MEQPSGIDIREHHLKMLDRVEQVSAELAELRRELLASLYALTVNGRPEVQARVDEVEKQRQGLAQ